MMPNRLPNRLQQLFRRNTTGRNQPAGTYAPDAYYESAVAVATLGGWYVGAKEQAFVAELCRLVPPLIPGKVVELGGGAGVHGKVFTSIYGDRYVMTDLATAQVHAAEVNGVSARIANALLLDELLNELGEPISMLLSVGLSTLIAKDGLTRCAQLVAMQAALGPGGICVVIVPRLGRLSGLHTLRRSEFNAVPGMAMVAWTSWGLLPGTLRRVVPVRLADTIDAIAGRLGVGVRRIAVLRRC
jgi:hypothetical protein